MGADSEAELTLVIKAKNLASREVDRLHGSLTKAKGAAGGLGDGLVTLTKVGVLGLAAGLVGVIGFLGIATKKAMEEQVGIDRMTTALAANVKGFSGNTDSIEALIHKREDLAFSDGDLRDSLTTLVTKYKDVDQAQRIQGVAMDVARLKGISLADATALVTKGMDGNKKILTQLGIELPKTASAQDRLTAIQAKAAGQAEKYGASAAGGQEAFQIAMDDVIEDVGSGLIPIITAAFGFLRTQAIPAIRGVIGAVSKWMSENRPLIDQIRNVLVKVIGMVIEKISLVVGWIGRFVGAIAGNKDAMNFLKTIMGAIAEEIGLVWEAISRVVGFIADLVSAISHNKPVMAAFAAGFDAIHAAVSAVVDALRWIIDNIGRVLGAIGSIKLPDLTGWIPHFAAGGEIPGPVGQPKLIVGHGGERVVKSAYANAQGGAAASPSGVLLLGVSERDLEEMIDRRQYFRLQRAAPTMGRS